MKRRTFLKTSAASAAALSISGCGGSGSSPTSTSSTDKSQRHDVSIQYNIPTNSISDILDTLSPENRVLADNYIAEMGLDNTTKLSGSSKYYFKNTAMTTSSASNKAPSLASSNDEIDLHVISTDFSSIKATVFYITHDLDTPADDGRTYGLDCLYLYIPDSDSPVNDDGSIDIVIDNPVDETIKALLFMHPSLFQLDATKAAQIVSHIDLDSLYNIWKIQIILTNAMLDDSWYTATALSDPSTSEEILFTDGDNAGTSIYKFIPTDDIGSTLADPLRDLINQVSNDPDLTSIFKHAPTASDTVDTTPSRASRWRSSLRKASSTDTTTAGSSVTLESNVDKYGYKIELSDTSTYGDTFNDSSLDSDTPVVKLKFENSYRRYISFYAQYNDIDGNAIDIDIDGSTGNDAWEILGGDASSYNDDSTFLMKMLSAPSEFYSIPTEDYSEDEIQIAFHPDANSITVYGATVGSYGDRSTLMEPLPAAMTITFEMIIPTILLAVSAAIQDEDAWDKIIISDGLSFIETIYDDLIVASANGGLTSDQLLSFAMDVGIDAISAAISLNSGAISEFLFGEVEESEVEDAIPIVGIVLMVANVAAAVSELAQTSVAIANSAWVSSTELTRTHSVSLQVLPDENDFEFPESSDTVTLILQSAQGKVCQEVTMNKEDIAANSDTSVIVDQTLFEDGSSSTVEAVLYTFTDVPEGGVINVSAFFTSSSTGSVLGFAQLVGVTNLDSPTYAFRIEEILTTLSSESVYTHKRKLAYSSSGDLEWSDTTTPPSTLYNLRSDGTTDNEISKLLSISINDKSGALGYSFTTEIDGVFKTISKNVSAKSDTPSEGYKEIISTSDTNSFVLYSMLAEPEAINESFLLYLKDGIYYAKSISIDPDLNDFAISDTTNYGKFSVVISAAAYDSTNKIMAGIDSVNKRLHILSLSDTELSDDDTSANGQRLSIATTGISSDTSSSDYEILSDLLTNPSVVSFSPTSRLFVVDSTSTNDYIKVFNVYGSPLAYSSFGGATYSVLKTEIEDIEYLDLSVDSQGYFFILKTVGGTDSIDNYKLDLYDIDGTFLAQTSGMAANKMHADYWRNIYSLNYEQTTNDGHSEPTISIWVPPVTGGELISDYQ